MLHESRQFEHFVKQTQEDPDKDLEKRGYLHFCVQEVLVLDDFPQPDRHLIIRKLGEACRETSPMLPRTPSGFDAILDYATFGADYDEKGDPKQHFLALLKFKWANPEEYRDARKKVLDRLNAKLETEGRTDIRFNIPSI